VLPEQWHAGSQTLHEQNPPVLNWRFRLTQVELYNGHRTVVAWVVYMPRINATCYYYAASKTNLYKNISSIWPAVFQSSRSSSHMSTSFSPWHPWTTYAGNCSQASQKSPADEHSAGMLPIPLWTQHSGFILSMVNIWALYATSCLKQIHKTNMILYILSVLC